MQVVYEAENIIDAYLVKGLLEQAGMPVYVRGEYLIGAIGELPVAGLVAVCVPAICIPEAGRLLQEFRQQREAEPLPLDSGDWLSA